LLFSCHTVPVISDLISMRAIIRLRRLRKPSAGGKWKLRGEYSMVNRGARLRRATYKMRV
jgi:hypothetical protein